MSIEDLIRRVPVGVGEELEGREFENLAVNIGVDPNTNRKFVIVAMFDGDDGSDIDEESTYFAIETKEQCLAVIDCLQKAMKETFDDD